MDLEITTVCTQMMLESPALELLAFKEPSDFKEALPLKDVWRFVTAMSGALCATTSGITLMLELLVDNWDYQAEVIIVVSRLGLSL